MIDIIKVFWLVPVFNAISQIGNYSHSAIVKMIIHVTNVFHFVKSITLSSSNMII